MKIEGVPRSARVKAMDCEIIVSDFEFQSRIIARLEFELAHYGPLSDKYHWERYESSYPPWQQHPTRHQLYGHLPPITKTIQVRRTRHAGHCWRSRDELIRDVLLWIPTHGRAKAGRPARTYIQQLCEDTGCCPEDLPRAMNDREEWRERVRDIRAASTIWWWWWLFFYENGFGIK